MRFKKPSSKIIMSLVIAFDILLFALLGGGWYFASVLMYPSDFVCNTNHYIYCNDPEKDLGLEFENVELLTSDQFHLQAWYVPAKKNSGKAIISVHGRGGDRREGLRYLKTIHELGVNVIMLDLRNSGKSDKSFNSMSFHERKDVDAAFRFLKEQKSQSSIGILGFSMGGATSIIYMANNPEIKVGIFDSPFADFEQVITENAKMIYGIPKYPLLPIVVFLYELRTNSDASQMSPKNEIGKISPRPVLLFHGTGDTRVPYSHASQLLESAKEPKELITVPDGKHTMLWQVDTRIQSKVVEYISKYL
jgi:fermentation-respiration switch protein FrsA (DUF1100 family)